MCFKPISHAQSLSFLPIQSKVISHRERRVPNLCRLQALYKKQLLSPAL